MATVNDILEHHGIKGMRWGVRRKGGSVKVSTTTTRPVSEDHVVSRELKKHPTKTLSNHELGQLNKRLQLEKTLSELTASPTKVSKGHKRAKDILSLIGTANQVHTTLNSPLANQVKKAIKKQ